MNLKKIGSILFHRTALVALFLLFQIGLLMVTIVRFSDYFISVHLERYLADSFCLVLLNSTQLFSL